MAQLQQHDPPLVVKCDFLDKSVLEAIQDVRFSRIQSLLANPRQELESLAGLCGYESQNALRKFFKARTGLTLSAWRKRHAGT